MIRNRYTYWTRRRPRTVVPLDGAALAKKHVVLSSLSTVVKPSESRGTVPGRKRNPREPAGAMQIPGTPGVSEDPSGEPHGGHVLDPLVIIKGHQPGVSGDSSGEPQRAMFLILWLLSKYTSHALPGTLQASPKGPCT